MDPGGSVRVFITTLGCKANQSDSSRLKRTLSENGYEPVKNAFDADICIINTCTVTAKADYQCRQLIRRLKKDNPGVKVLVTGCYVNVSGDDVSKMPEVDGIAKHSDLIDLILSSYPPDRREAIPLLDTSKTRPFVKIQDGCNNFCTYCIVPFARGPERSVNAQEILKEMRELGETGHHEVVLTGIHIGAYGSDMKGEIDLYGLLEKIIKERPVSRVRLSSLEPAEIDDRLISLIAANNDLIAPHFHVPLQSGSESVLKRMGRRYTPEFYSERINAIAAAIPNVGVGADVIVGFPDETDNEFEETRGLIDRLPLTYLHIFSYSKREGTKAAAMGDTVNGRVKKLRADVLLELSNAKKSAFFARQKGLIHQVVVEGKRDRESGLLKGLTGNYIPVLVDGSDALMGRLLNVQIVDVIGIKVYGRPSVDNQSKSF